MIYISPVVSFEGVAVGHVIHIPLPLLPAFKKVIQQGMAFEHGQPPELYKFADELREIPDVVR
jgi:hypothetical protein